MNETLVEVVAGMTMDAVMDTDSAELVDKKRMLAVHVLVLQNEVAQIKIQSRIALESIQIHIASSSLLLDSDDVVLALHLSVEVFAIYGSVPFGNRP